MTTDTERYHPKVEHEEFTNEQANQTASILKEMLNSTSGPRFGVKTNPSYDRNFGDNLSKTHSYVVVWYRRKLIATFHNTNEMHIFLEAVHAIHNAHNIFEEELLEQIPETKPLFPLTRIVDAVKESLTPELKQKDYPAEGMGGYCYIAAEAIYHLQRNHGTNFGGELVPMQMQWEGVSHWFLKSGEYELDITKMQFNILPDYSLAKHRAFFTKQPSKRAQIVIDRALDKLLIIAEREENIS